MSLKGPGMARFAPGARVRIPRLGGAPGTVQWCRARDRMHPPRIFEAVVELDDGRRAWGVSACFEALGAAPTPAGMPPAPTAPAREAL